MKRKLWSLTLLIFVMGLVWCGAAVADDPAFTRQPVGGTIVPDGGREISWATNFTPVRVVLGYSYYHDGGFWGGSGWHFVERKSIETGLQPDMKAVITYSNATTSDRWVVRAYYNDTQYEESQRFSIDVISRQFTASPAGGTVDPEGSLVLDWETNFKPVRIEIGRRVASGYDWFLDRYTTTTFVSDLEISSGLKKKMSWPLPYDSATSSGNWYVRAYYDDGLFLDSQPFTVTVTGREFITQPEGGIAPIQGKRTFSWATNFHPTRIEILHSWTVTTKDWFNPNIHYTSVHEELIEELSGSATSYSCYATDGIVVRAYYNDSGYEDSERFFITEDEGRFTAQPQGGLATGGTTLDVSWVTDFTPNKLEFISLSANQTGTVIDTWEGAAAAHKTGSYPFPTAQGSHVNARYIIRATYTNGYGSEKTVSSDLFYVGSTAADYHFITQPQDCYAVDMHWSSVNWAVNFLPEKVEYLRGSGTDVSQYEEVSHLYPHDTYRYAVRCYYSVDNDLYCTSDTFTVTYYQDVWTKQPEGGSYVVGTKFHLTWGLQFTPQTIILRYCTPEGHPITQVPQFEMDPDKSWYDMEIESGNPSQYYYIWAWLDGTHYVVSDPFRVQKYEDYIFVQQPVDITVPDSGAESLNWITGFTPQRTEVCEFAVGDPEQALTVTELDDPTQDSFEVTADGTNRERAFIIRAWYSATEYVDSTPAIATQELIERVFTVQPESGTIPVNAEYALTWRTNFTPIRTEIWRGGYGEGEVTDPSLYQTMDDPRATSCPLENDSPGTLYGYAVRAYWTDTQFVSSSAAAVYHERSYRFIRQPQIGDASSDEPKLPVTWEVDFVPVRTEIVRNGAVTETLAEGITACDLTGSIDEYFIRVYYDDTGSIESDPFKVDVATITFLLGHGSSQGPYYVYVKTGSSYSLPKCMFHSPSESGWLGHFVDWGVGKERIRKPVGTVIRVDQSTEIAAIWDTGDYTITFHPPGSGAYPGDCAEDIDPETGLLTYTWPCLYYANPVDDPIIRPLMGQLPNWSGYGPAPVHLYWDMVETMDENYKERSWPSTSSNHGYTVYERSVPVVRGFNPIGNAYGYVKHVDAYPVFGWRYYATYNANGGSGYVQSDTFEEIMGETLSKTYTVRQNSYTAPSRSSGNAPSWYRSDGWLLNGEPCASGTVMTVTGGNLPFVARWKDQYNDPGFYLYGIFDGETYGCSESADGLGDLFTQSGEDTWTVRVSSANGCHVSVKYYNGYYNESLWYHASASGDTAILTLAQATEDPADMMEIPAGSWLLTLEGNGDEGYTLRYEEANPLCTVVGDITDWDTVEMEMTDEGAYTYSVQIEPYMSWSGTFEFYFSLSDEDYTATATVFDAVDGLALAPMDMEENGSNIRLASSGSATYTFILDPTDMTLTVTNDLETPGAFLMGFMGDYPIRMRDPASGEVGMGEGGGSEPPVQPYHFPGGTTLWASASVSGGEWLEEGPTFYVGCNGQTWGTSSVRVDTPMTLQSDGRCPIWVDEDFDGAEFDFYYCPETHQLMIQKHINSHQLTLYTWNAAEERPMGEVTEYYEGDTDAFTLAPSSAIHYDEDWGDAPFVYDDDTITITAPDHPGYRVAAWYPCRVSTWWSSGSVGYELDLYGEEASLGSGNTLVYTVDNAYGDIHLTAVYEAGEAETVSIIFDSQGGTPEPEAQTLQSGETISEPQSPVKIGAVFTGWYTDAACEAESLFSFETPVTANLTLYAGWLIPEPDGILKLPVMLTSLEDEAFAGIAAEAVIIPASVTSIEGNPFSGSSVLYIYGSTELVKNFAAENGYIFVPVGD